MEKDDEPFISSVLCDFDSERRELGAESTDTALNVVHLTVQTSLLGDSATRCDALLPSYSSDPVHVR